MTRRIIVSVRDRMQLGFDKLNVVAKQFSGNTSQAVGNMTQENAARSKIYMYVSFEIRVSMSLRHLDECQTN